MAATQSFNLAIPHLKPEQKVRDWRTLYTAATSLLTAPQQIGHLPIAVDRSLWLIRSGQARQQRRLLSKRRLMNSNCASMGKSLGSKQ